MSRVSFHTLGCKLNFAETSSLQRQFELRGFEAVGQKDACDISVINTCSVTAEADRKCRQIIRRTHRLNPDAFILVTGCYAQLRPDEVAKIEGVSAVLGNSEKAHIFDLLDDFVPKESTQVNVSCTGNSASFDSALLSDDRTRAFLKVQDGCDYSCSFCTIPLARGRSRSAPMDQVVDQARNLAERGIKEIVLTGVNIGLYGQGSQDTNTGKDLLQLLQQLATVDGILRYRISSIEPNLLTDEIIDFVAETSVMVPHFHIPLQSGENTVLGAMRRRYQREAYQQRLEYIHKHMPDAGIGADVIVGFPAETPEYFTETHTFLADLPVTYLHVFTYSERPNTVSANRFQSFNPISSQERRTRNRTLQELSARKQTLFQERFRGQIRPVLWERTNKSGNMQGYTDNYIRMTSSLDKTRVGTIENVRLGTEQVMFVS
ncbi:MAG: tRNA (N(6)-L-threonylcarbamoyladenosine(37)-C(2))-methylthiotransferase MtaB [Bacteroidetes bacterium]|nr:tRNA (N(6)-L-threonylcarbamoyladenosine(37)-C(2))-methylthiotransferase MtaB [Bacteroidota bacterium]MCY4205699.1 tRNA (N(6)-L-threonylcarbamoyladenosine(37)-C(2))-methylthiotransferase MtaB [Bacteroidota bacterium]